MIAIVNLGPAPGNKQRGVHNQAREPLGPHLYQVKINSTVKAVFTHTRGDSLATCLRKAADAYEAAHAADLHRLIAAAAEPAFPEAQ